MTEEKVPTPANPGAPSEAPVAPAAAPAPPEDPSIVGELTEEEQAIFTTYKRNQSTGNQELGQYAYRSFQVARAMEDQTVEFQKFSKELIEKKNLNVEGMQYQLLGNGKIRGIKVPQAEAAAQVAAAAAAPAPPAPVSEADAKVNQLKAALAKAQADANGAALAKAQADANGADTEAKV